MTASNRETRATLPLGQITIVLAVMLLANGYYWLLNHFTPITTSSIFLGSIGALVFLLPARQWHYTLPSIAIVQLLLCHLLHDGDHALTENLLLLGGGFCSGFIPKYMTKLWSPKDYDGYAHKYIPSAIPAFICYSLSLVSLYALRYGSDFSEHFQTLDDILLHANFLEFTAIGSIIFTFLMIYQAPGYHLKNYRDHYPGIILATLIYLGILYSLPGNYFVIIILLLTTIYLYGTPAINLITVSSALLAPFALGQDGAMFIQQAEFTNYAAIIFVIGVISLTRDGFVYAARQGKPFTISLSQSGNIGFTMTSPEVDALRLQLEQQSIEINQANKELAASNSNLFELTQSLEQQKQTYKHLVEVDELTNLKSRRYFSSHMADGQRQQTYCLLMIDLDNFKSVNDLYGHQAGDRLLKDCAELFQQACHEPSFAARLGGEEFCIVLATNDMDMAIELGENLRQRVAQSITSLDNIDIARSISVGVAKLTPDTPLKDAMSQADGALYLAKQGGKNCLRVANQAFIDDWHRERNAPKLDAIVKGLENDEFCYYLQPICDINTGQILGFEALLRWQRVDGSILTPHEFIDILLSRPVYDLYRKVSNQLILPIIQQLQALNEDYYLAINADSIFFHTPRYVAETLQQLAQAGADCHKLIIELPETAQIHNQQLVLENIARLRKQGIRIALDDFGMEHSNMDRIRDIPADFVKIDRSFIIDLQKNPRSTSVVRALVNMSQELTFDTIAEGIEEQEQADALISAGVTKAQGYFYGKPQPIEHWLKQLN